MLDDLSIKVIWNLVARPDLNAIERYWSLAKIIFRRRLLEELLVHNKINIAPIVKESLLAVNNYMAKKLAVSGIKRLKDRRRVHQGLISIYKSL